LSSSSEGEDLPAAPISGSLARTPLVVVLRRIQQDKLSGTLSVLRDDQVRQFFFEDGELHAARSSREDHRIGATLVRWGYISQRELEEALEQQRQSHDRIDRILIERGLVTRAIVDSEARRQMEQIVFSTLSWIEGTFHFEANTGEMDLDVNISLSQEMIIEGIRRIPESEQFVELLGDLSAVPFLRPAAENSSSFRLLREAMSVLSRIDGKTELKAVLGAEGSQTASAKILYALLFAGLMEIRTTEGTGWAAGSAPPASKIEGAPGAPRATTEGVQKPFLFDLRKPSDLVRVVETGKMDASPVETPRPTPRATSPPPSPQRPAPTTASHKTDREIVLEMYRQLDWLSHYDLLGVSQTATDSQIAEAFRSRSRLFDPTLKAHPEFVDLWRQLTVLYRWLRIAHGVLSNAATRSAYDKKIAEATPDRPEKKR
jgi:hypothetical protein